MFVHPRRFALSAASFLTLTALTVTLSSTQAVGSTIAQDAPAPETAAVSYTIDQMPVVNDAMAKVDHTKIYSTIKSLSENWPNRSKNSKYGKLAAEWMKSTWTEMAAGRGDIAVTHTAPCSSCSGQPNTLMTMTGTTNPTEYLVIGAHIDSISNSGSGDNMKAPGADDDASGVATLTEAARVLINSGWRPQKSIVFAAYAGEENGLLGSNDLARIFKREGRNVVAVMNLDMTNWRGSNPSADMRFMGDYVNGTLNDYTKKLFKQYLSPKGYTYSTTTCGYACSDHASWYNQGYPSVYPQEPVLSPYMHTTNDTLAKMGNTAEPSAKFAQLALAFLIEIAKTGAGTPSATPTATPTTSAPTTTPTSTPTATTPTSTPTTTIPTSTPTTTTPAPDDSECGTLVSNGTIGIKEELKVGDTINVKEPTTLNGCLTAGENTDFELYLQRWNGSAWRWVERSIKKGTNEKVTYDAGTGYYRWLVYSYAGSGAFTLKHNL